MGVPMPYTQMVEEGLVNADGSPMNVPPGIQF